MKLPFINPIGEFQWNYIPILIVNNKNTLFLNEYVTDGRDFFY